jgi:cytochrome d ubiquinol oxidase subunit I
VRWLLWVLAFALPLPWIAAESGWVVAEVGRQPWVVEGVLPTFLAVSGISTSNVLVTLFGFIGFYTALLLVDIFLMIKAIRLGPEHNVPQPRARELPAASGAE